MEIWTGLTVADFYAGTGALGIEALSRGASWCDFFDVDPSARRVIARNLETTGFRDRGRVYGLDARRVVEGAAGEVGRIPFDIVLMDPPYRDHSVTAVAERLAIGELLADAALVAVEHSVDLPLAEVYAGKPMAAAGGADVSHLVEVRERRHGDTILSIYRLVRQGERGAEGDGDNGDLPR